MRFFYLDDKCKWRYQFENIVFEYDTAYELGQLVAQSGRYVPNPYDPNNTDFDDFTYGLNSEKKQTILELG